MIDRLGILQIDSVNALVRSHYLPLFPSLASIAADLLDQAAWSQGRQRTLFKCWGHEASLYGHIDVSTDALAHAAGKPVAKTFISNWRVSVVNSRDTVRRVLACTFKEQRRDQRRWRLSTPPGNGQGPGGSWSAEKHALEWLFAAGEVTVAGRRGPERLL